MDQRLNQFVESLHGASAPAELQGQFSHFILEIGFSVFTYAGLRFPTLELPAPLIQSDFPGAWRQEYDGNQYENIDPAIFEPQHTMLPILWDDLIQREDLSKSQKSIFHEAKTYGLQHGLTIPVHGQMGEYAIVSIASNLSDRDFRKAHAEFKHDLHMAAIYYHDQLRNMVGKPKYGGGNVQLSPREKECLLWASRGKTSWETAEILKISINTVNYYLKSAMKKLGVFNKQHAVVRAIMLYLIFP